MRKKDCLDKGQSFFVISSEAAPKAHIRLNPFLIGLFIQNASKVRSSNGLWLHCFGKLAVARLV
jgi:hypothetical protein